MTKGPSIGKKASGDTDLTVRDRRRAARPIGRICKGAAFMQGKVEIAGVNTAKLKVLKSSETQQLLLRAKAGDMQAREELIAGNLRLVLSVIQRFANRGENADDLFQVGCIGLIKAIDNFNTDLDVKFSTYGVPMIVGEIRRYLRDNGLIKVGRSLREQSIAIYTARERLRAQMGREPVLSELSEATGLTPEEIAVAELAAAPPDSLQQENADGLTLESTLASAATEEHLVERIALRAAIDQALSELAEDGTLTQLSVKYFGVDISQP